MGRVCVHMLIACVRILEVCVRIHLTCARRPYVYTSILTETLIQALLLLFPCFICVICFCPKLVSMLKSICFHALLCLFVFSMLVRILIFWYVLSMHMNINMHWCIGVVVQWGKSCTHMNMYRLEYGPYMSNKTWTCLFECHVYGV